MPDPYRWLERADDPAVRDWRAAEARLTDGYLSALPEREAIRKRLTALWGFERTEVPWREGGRIFSLRSDGTRPQPVLYVQSSIGAQPRVALDPNLVSPDGSIEMRDYSVSADGRLVAYNAAPGGRDLAETRVRQLATGKDLGDVVGNVLNGVCWTRDGRGFFYVRQARRPAGAPDTARPASEVAYHLLGTPRARDRVVVAWPDARWVYAMLSDEGRWALFVSELGEESQVYALDLGDPRRPDPSRPAVRLLAEDPAYYTPLDVVGGSLILRTNLGAPRGRIAGLELRRGAAARPRTIVPEAADVIESAAVAGDRIVIHYLVDVRSRLRLYALDGSARGEIALPGIGAVGWPLNGRPSTRELFYSFVSFLEPPTVYRYDLARRRSAALRPPRPPFDASAYETRQVFFQSRDGTRVPMFVTAAKGLVLDGTHPALLTAYGGYGANLTPQYMPDVPFWLERGGVYAAANIRGGGEYGQEWHRAGMLGKKQNSFDDFIAAAEALISRGWTSASRLAIYGHSNGGLLIGAAITQRPELFAAAVPNAGHYDMLRYQLFTVGAGWVPEYGSSADPQAFRWLLAYSPLHNVRPGTCYPATMLLAADHDDRVVPSHSYKFAAALQAAQSCDRPILLRVAADSSHQYSSRTAQIEERTDMWSFILSRVGGSNGAGR